MAKATYNFRMAHIGFVNINAPKASVQGCDHSVTLSSSSTQLAQAHRENVRGHINAVCLSTYDEWLELLSECLDR